jgi:hypothetical protein
MSQTRQDLQTKSLVLSILRIHLNPLLCFVRNHRLADIAGLKFFSNNSLRLSEILDSKVGGRLADPAFYSVESSNARSLFQYSALARSMTYLLCA